MPASFSEPTNAISYLDSEILSEHEMFSWLATKYIADETMMVVWKNCEEQENANLNLIGGCQIAVNVLF